MNICVIGNSETTIGFGLIGVKESYEVSSSEEAYEKYTQTKTEVIILSEEFSELIEKKKKDDKIIIKVSKKSKTASMDNISRLVKDVLGFDINV